MLATLSAHRGHACAKPGELLNKSSSRQRASSNPLILPSLDFRWCGNDILNQGFPGLFLQYLSFSIMAFGLLLQGFAQAEPTVLGQTGLISMPDARLEEDGEFRLGVSNSDPYFALWSSVTILPRLEVSGRYTTIKNIPVFEDGSNVGDFRDKAFDAKFLLFRERRYLPQLTLGTQDYLGTRLFSADFVALNKRFGDADVALGYGKDRIDGWFGGIRYEPSWTHNIGLVVEYDANDYTHDYQADVSGADNRAGGIAYALEYTYGWFGTQLSYQKGDVAANAYISVPLMEREFIPKIDEPVPDKVSAPQASVEEWRGDAKYTMDLEKRLDKEGFEDLQVSLQGNVITASLTHARISSVSRAIGRAARLLVFGGPRDIETVKITYTANDLPVVTYIFNDIQQLKDYFSGNASWADVEQTAEIVYADVGVTRDENNTPAQGQGLGSGENLVLIGEDEDRYNQAVYNFNPFNLRFLFNITRSVPGRAFHYDIFSLLSYRKRMSNGLFLVAAGRLKLYEDVSDISLASDSLLPHVRSDIAEYKQGGYLKLDSLLINKYLDLPGRMSARLSAGYYEEMYAGVGGQFLYMSRAGNWAVDLMVDGLKQREPGENFSFRDYSVLTSLLSAHYTWPEYGLTATARAGQFLAKDDGIRYEFKRRFRSGVEVGAWYTVTNGHDITGPGSPDAPYRDKGVFLAIPLSSMLTMDTQESAYIALSPWMRDVGQMVVPPEDLYRLMERAAAAGSVGIEGGRFIDFKM